jgi:hypothetical protein
MRQSQNRNKRSQDKRRHIKRQNKSIEYKQNHEKGQDNLKTMQDTHKAREEQTCIRGHQTLNLHPVLHTVRGGLLGSIARRENHTRQDKAKTRHHKTITRQYNHKTRTKTRTKARPKPRIVLAVLIVHMCPTLHHTRTGRRVRDRRRR